MAEEEWRPIPGTDHYEASSFGRVRALHRRLPHAYMGGVRFRTYPAAIQKQWPMPSGYLLCSINGVPRLVNRLVCAAFHGPPPSDAHEAAHIDGVLDHNLPGNLIWATHRENENHKVLHGTLPIGERNGAAKLTAEDIPAVFAEYLLSDAPTVAEKFGVDRGCIYEILKRRNWRHVPVDEEVVRAASQRARENLYGLNRDAR